MNLIIDQGNTVTKIAVVDAGEIIFKTVEPVLTTSGLEKILSQFPEIRNGILSSVAVYGSEIRKFLEQNLKEFIIPDSDTPLPVKNKYSTKNTLGYDRLADVVGAYTIYPGKNVLIFDIGTAITIDFLSAGGEFSGGNISPGLDLRFRALHEHTKRLPLIEKKEEFPFMGDTTENAILAGVLNGMAFEIEGYINNFKVRFPDLITILTGGDYKYFDKKLKNSIFVHSNLNITGLNRILEYNAKKN